MKGLYGFSILSLISQPVMAGGCVMPVAGYAIQPCFALLVLILVFSVFYMIVLRLSSKKNGILKDGELPLHHNNLIHVVILGVYFSLLSTLRFGWKDFNLAYFITGLQRTPYVLEATGWVRTLSGLQTLIGAYLIILWVLCAV